MEVTAFGVEVEEAVGEVDAGIKRTVFEDAGVQCFTFAEVLVVGAFDDQFSHHQLCYCLTSQLLTLQE